MAKPPYRERVCTICLEDLKESHKIRAVEQCGHCFHSVCIRNWLRRVNTCPNCQSVALPDSGLYAFTFELEPEPSSKLDINDYIAQTLIPMERYERGMGRTSRM